MQINPDRLAAFSTEELHLIRNAIRRYTTTVNPSLAASLDLEILTETEQRADEDELLGPELPQPDPAIYPDA